MWKISVETTTQGLERKCGQSACKHAHTLYINLQQYTLASAHLIMHCAFEFVVPS